ncbi:MAG: aromatic acid decarboxylase, partial [Armatimonadetes bacterium]
TVEEIIDHTTSRVLDLFGIENDLVKRWGGG